MSAIELNAKTINNEIKWFSALLEHRMSAYKGKTSKYKNIFEIETPSLDNDFSTYAQIIKHYKFSFIERLAIILALIPQIKPELLDCFLTINTKTNRHNTEFGGIVGEHFSGFLPTGETLAFMITGNLLANHLKIYELFEATHVFAKHKILELAIVADNEPPLSGSITINRDFVELFTLGKATKPNFSTKFPAKLISTQLDWDDFIIDTSVNEELFHVLSWIKHKDTLLNKWNLQKIIKPGYRALFYGPSGTGKTFAVTLIGKQAQKDVYKIDISMLVSKWVGETEKNLSRVFDMAENKDWILFFDEADALFGKRTSTQSSQEKFANQEVAYLLQRTEDYPGTVILASNLKGNIDEAFTRRFQSIVYFPMPKAKERYKIWTNYLEQAFELDDKTNIKKIANDYELTGGNIVNVIKFCAIRCAERNERKIIFDDIIEGIRKELLKEGITI